MGVLASGRATSGRGEEYGKAQFLENPATGFSLGNKLRLPLSEGSGITMRQDGHVLVRSWPQQERKSNLSDIVTSSLSVG